MSTILKCTLNWNYIAKYFYKNTILRNSNWKVIKITFDSSSHTFFVSLKILVDYFSYFGNKNNLKCIDENENCMNISCVTKNTFETLLKFIVNGRFKLLVFILVYYVI